MKAPVYLLNTPENRELKRLTLAYHASVDRKAIEAILFGEPSWEVIERWRVSANLSKNALARVTGYTTVGILMAQRKRQPPPHRFLEYLREFIRVLDSDGFQELPTSKDIRPVLAPQQYRDLEAMNKMVLRKNQRWGYCQNPNCRKLTFFAQSNARYCSVRCKEIMHDRRKRTGARAVPELSNLHGRLFSGDLRKASRKAHHDSEEQVE